MFLLAITIAETFGAAIEITIEDDESNSRSLKPGGESAVEDDVIRIKRSGSGDIFGFIKKGITSKLTQVAQASAGASAHFSKGSSGGSSGGGGGGYYYPSPHSHVSLQKIETTYVSP